MAHPKSILAILALLFFIQIRAADPELLEDFTVPGGVDENKIDGGFFTYTGLRGGAPSSNGAVGQKIISVHEFPALNGMGLSLELVEFPVGSVNAPHTHPRGAEILFVMDGVLTVGVSDGNGKLYKNVLQKGDVFVFPKGLSHYQANFDKTKKACGMSVFASSNAGTVALPKALFGSNIPDEVLAKVFKISADTLQQLKAGQN